MTFLLRQHSQIRAPFIVPKIKHRIEEMTAVRAIMVETESCVKHVLLVPESSEDVTIIKFFTLVAIILLLLTREIITWLTFL